MAIDKVKFPNGNTENIQDSRIPGVDSTPTANSVNLVTSGGVKSALSGYLPLSGGTLTGLLRISSGDDAKIILDNTDNETNYQQIVFSQNGTEYARLGTFRNTILRWQIGNSSYKIWHEGNDGSGSELDADLLDGQHGSYYATAASVTTVTSDITTLQGYFTNGVANSATKLQTARSIWGQSFDGTGNVSGNMTGVGEISMSRGIVSGGTSEGVFFGNAKSGLGPDYKGGLVFADGGQPLYFYTNYTNRMTITGVDGNVGIGTASPTYKLDVNGTAVFGSAGSADGIWIRRSGGGNIVYRIGSKGTSGSDADTLTIQNSSGTGATMTLLNGLLTMDGGITTTIRTSQPSGGMLPNREYKLGTLSSATTFTLAAETSGVTNHYFWTFETGSTAPSITWPSAITSWAGGSAPSINSNRHYEVSVLNGVAVVLEV